MREFQDRYEMSTIEFYAQFVTGKLGHCRDFISWAATYQSYEDLLQEKFEFATSRKKRLNLLPKQAGSKR